MLRITILLLLTIAFSNGHAQTRTNYTDSVVHYLLLSKLAKTIDQQSFDRAISLIDSVELDDATTFRLEQLANEFRTLRDKTLYYQISYAIVFRLQQLKRYDQQIEYGKLVIDHYENNGDTSSKKQYCDILHSLRVPFRSTPRINEGFDYYGQKLKKYFPLNDTEVISLCYFVYGGFYMTQGLGDMATYYFKKSISYLDPNNTTPGARMGLQVWLDKAGNLPFLYNRIENYTEAAHFASVINQYNYNDKTRNDSMNRSLHLRHFAEAKMMLHEFDSVEVPLTRAEELARLTNSIDNIAACNEVRGRYYFLQDKMDTAFQFLSTASTLITQNNIPPHSPWGILIPNYYLAQIEEKRGNHQQAARYILSELPKMINLKRESLKEMKLLISIYMAMGNGKAAEATYRDFISKQHEFDSTDQANRVMSFENEKILEDLSTQKSLQEIEVVRQKKQKTVYLAGVLLLAALLLLVFLNFRNQRRVNRLMNIDYEREKTELELKSQQDVLNERLRISRDLHDEVGATLSGIAMYSHLAKTQLSSNNTTDTGKSLGVIEESSIKMVDKLSDIVWLVNPSQDTIKGLFEKLRDYAIEIGAAKNIMVDSSMEPAIADITIPIEARRNIYMICKESINNAVKYSQANSLTFTAGLHNDEIRFSIIDNGVGFDMSSIKKGNGLDNMQHRAKEVGANFYLDASKDRGTQIIISYRITQQGMV